ncbi:hypothetical protein D3C85_597470 [compost metagenome]
MTVIGVLAKTGIGHDDHLRYRILADPRHARHQTVFMPGVAAVAIQMMGHAERHHRLDTRPCIPFDFTGQFRLGNTAHARHAGDRHEIVDFFLDKDRQDQVIEGELGFLEQAAQLRGAPQTARTGFGELAGHGVSWQEANGLDKTKVAKTGSLCPCPLATQMHILEEFITDLAIIDVRRQGCPPRQQTP